MIERRCPVEDANRHGATCGSFSTPPVCEGARTQAAASALWPAVSPVPGNERLAACLAPRAAAGVGRAEGGDEHLGAESTPQPHPRAETGQRRDQGKEARCHAKEFTIAPHNSTKEWLREPRVKNGCEEWF